jgi:hypothetical protein
VQGVVGLPAAGQTEVCNNPVAEVSAQHVVGLEVPVQDRRVNAVDNRQRAQRVAQQDPDLVRLRRIVTDEVLEAAAEQLHRDPRSLLVVDADAVDGDDVGTGAQLDEHFRFAPQHGDPGLVVEVHAAEDLDRGRTGEALAHILLGPIDDRVAPGVDLLEEMEVAQLLLHRCCSSARRRLYSARRRTNHTNASA